MKDAPAFDFYPSDWLSGTLMMSHEEKGLYVDLLAMQWEQGCLPSDDKLKRLRARPAVLASVLDKFPIGEDGKRRNARLESERVKQRERRERKSEGARKTNAKRWNSESLSDRLATVERQPSDTLSESPPITNHQSPVVLLEKEPKGAGAPDVPKKPKAVKDEDFTKACAVDLDLLAPEPVREAWAEYQAERQRRHRASTAKGFQPWTTVAATRAAKHITDHLDKLTPQQIADHIRAAINAGWKGLFLEKLHEPAHPQHRFPHQNRDTAPRFAALQTPASDGDSRRTTNFRV